MADRDDILASRGREPRDVIRWGSDPDQLVELRGKADAPLVVVVHGGYWRPGTDRTHAGRMSDALADAGFRVATVEYRRIPGDPDASLADVRAGIAAAVSAGVAAEPSASGADAAAAPVVIGHSAGGHLALVLAATPGDTPVRAAIALGPVADLVLGERLDLGDGAVRAYLGVPAADRPDLDPAALPDATVPVRILHGDADEVVPLALAESYAAAHPLARLDVLAGAGHFGVIDPSSAVWPTVLAAVREAVAG